MQGQRNKTGSKHKQATEAEVARVLTCVALHGSITEENIMTFLKVFFMFMTLDLAWQAWKVGMRQLGKLLAVCSVLGFGGTVFFDSPILLVPLIGALVLGFTANYQMRKYRVGRYKDLG
jgi:hypothetical protein